MKNQKFGRYVAQLVTAIDAGKTVSSSYYVGRIFFFP